MSPPRVTGRPNPRRPLLPLPGPSHLTLWRGRGDEVVGGFVASRGGEGFAVYGALLEDRDAIDRELVEAGLPEPVWERDERQASITLSWPSPLPWDEAEEARQLELMGRAANGLVNAAPAAHRRLR